MAQPKTITGGVIAAAVTPRRAREHSIDLASTLELIDFLYEGGVDGIALLGSTGEFVHFELEDRARMLDFAVKRSRLPILVNVSHSTLDGALFLGQEAIGSGVAAVLLMPPYFFRYSQNAVHDFCLRFAEEIAKDVPVYLYNIPVFSNSLELETARKLLGTGLFAGIKDSSGDPAYIQGLVGGAFHVFNGDDHLYLSSRRAGAQGGVSGVSCAIPELLARLDKAIREMDAARAEKLDSRVQEFLKCIAPFPAPVAIKEAVRQRKIKTGSLATPLGADAERDLAAFAEWFKNWLPAVLKECRG